jgi:beta-carotene 3-hydroxylase
MTAILIGLAAAVVMEPIAALLHRLVMHGRGWGWHRDHHTPRRMRFETNDLFPLVFAAVTITVMALGASVMALRPLLWIGAGVTAYGAAYLLVHDVCIHGRIGRPIERISYLRHVRRAHRVHHVFGREPYGFLFPVVPSELRARADRLDGDGRANVNATVDNLRAIDTRARRVKTS